MMQNFLISSATCAAATVGIQDSDYYAKGSIMRFLHDNDSKVLFVESNLTLLYNIQRSRNKQDICVAITTYYSAITGSSALVSLARLLDYLSTELTELITPVFQDSATEDWISVCEGLYANVNRLKRSKLANKILKVFNHVVAHAVYTKMGLEVDLEFLTNLESKRIRPRAWDFVSFLDSTVDLFLFLCRAGRQAIMTGNLEAFFVDSTTMNAWMTKASELRKHAEFARNPSILGMSTVRYVGKLKECISTGRLISKALPGEPSRIISAMVLELDCVLRRLQSILLAAKFRRAPIGVGIVGDAGVGKSFIVHGLFNLYCSIAGIKKEDAKLWPRTEDDKYFSGYQPEFVGFLLDDIAKTRPSKVTGVDPTLEHIIACFNNAPFITPQAEAADKGKIPFMSEIGFVTSNVPDYNVRYYYEHPSAIFRRLPVQIEPIVKEEFRKVVGGVLTPRIDEAKIPVGEQYPDVWTFDIRVFKNEGKDGSYVLEKTGQSYGQLCEFMIGVYKDHIAKQDKFMAAINSTVPEEICVCSRPKSICTCDIDTSVATHQSGDLYAPRQIRLANKWSHEVLAIKKYFKTRGGRFGHEFVCRLLQRAEYRDIRCDDSSIEDTLYLHVRKVMDAWVKFSKLSDVDKRLVLDVMPSPEPVVYYSCADVGEPRHFSVTNASYFVNALERVYTKAKKEDIDDYVQTEVPRLVSLGWTNDSILRGFVDYANHFEFDANQPFRSTICQLMLNPQEYESSWSWIGWFGKQYFTRPIVKKAVDLTFSFSPLRRAAASLVFGEHVVLRESLLSAAKTYDDKLGGSSPYVRALLAFCGTAGFIVIARTVWKSIFSTKLVTQADVMTTGKTPVAREVEKTNVWKQEQRNITKLDVPTNRPNTLDELKHGLVKNLCYCEVDGKKATRALVLDNETFVVNNHAVEDYSVVEMWLGPKTTEGLNPSVKIDLRPEMLTRHVDRDLVFVKTWGLPRRFKDIRKYLPNKTFKSKGACELVKKERDGELTVEPCFGMDYAHVSNCEGLDGFDHTVVLTSSGMPTKAGDCGSVLVVQSPIGSVIAGLHFAFFPNCARAAATPLYTSDVDSMKMVQLGPTNLVTPVFQSKLFTDYHKDGHMMVHGGLPGFRARPKFTGQKTDYADYVLSKSAQFDPPIEDNMDRPNPGAWHGAQQILANYKYPTHSMNETICRAVVAAMCNHFTSGLTEEDRADIHPVNLDVAINGYPGVNNIDAVQMSTSGGYGFRGPKLQYMTEPEKSGVWEHYRTLDQETRSAVQQMRDTCSQGIRPGSVFSMSYKDELLSKTKVEAGRVRGIYMCNLTLLLNMRMSTMGLTRVMVRRSSLFGIAVGLNTHSEEWDDIKKEADKFAEDLWLAGDFKAFEAVLSLLISNCVSKVLHYVAKWSGNYNEEELLIFETLLAEISNATIDFLGTLVTLLGGEVSGHQLTTFFNCMANMFLHCYAYVVIHARTCTYEDYVLVAQEFFDKVFIRTLGDDVMCKVSPDRKTYNHSAVQSVFESIGITYTMADKSSESVPFIPLSQVTFLKRSFVYHSEFPISVAALDKKSIYKMLLYTIPSKSVSKEEQSASAFASAQAEAFFHGKEFFDQIWDLIDGIPKSLELKHRMSGMPRPTWNTMIFRFLQSSPKLQIAFTHADVLTPVKTSTPQHSYCDLSGVVLQSGLSVDDEGLTTMGRSPEDRKSGAIRLSREQRLKEGECEDAPYLENNFLSKQCKHNTNTHTHIHDEEMTLDCVLPVITQLHNKQVRRQKKKKWCGLFQSEDLLSASPVMQGGETEVQEITAFVNEPSSVELPVPQPTNRLAQALQVTQDLSGYFSRPTKIFSTSWVENDSDGFKGEFYPWQAFFGDANMGNKLKGFTLIRGDMKIKIVINGSPFYYGAMLCNFTPLGDAVRDDTADKPGGIYTKVPESQKPHVWLTPQDMSDAKFDIPFVYPYPMVDTSFSSNLKGLGKVQFWQYAPLLSANGSTSTHVDITVYAWLENVMYSGLSDRPVLQSEYLPSTQLKSIATVGKVASSVLSMVPVLGPACGVATQVADTLGDVAAAFGYTNVPNVRDIEPFKPIPFSLASTEISEPIAKLSLQPKQEIAIGGTEFGDDPIDNLAIDTFVTRASYLTATDWSTVDTPGTVLFSAAVSPAMFDTNGSSVCVHTPLSYISTLFQYWRGDIDFTFKAVRSPYHRGRLGITWDRGAAAMSDGATPGNPNTYTTIMDLDKDSEATMRVPYQQAKQFLECALSSPFSTASQFSTLPTPPSTIFNGTNGVLQLRVVNRLTAPEASSAVRIMVFVAAAKGFAFAAPRDVTPYLPNASSYFYQLGPSNTAILQSEDIGSSESPVDATEDDDVYEQCFGEKVVSLREQLHRSSLAYLWSTNSTGATAGKFWNRIPIKRVPPTTGFVNNGWLSIGNGTSSQRANFAKWHPLTMITACFAGYKGSTNVTVNIDQCSTAGTIDTLSVTRLTDMSVSTSGNRLPSTTLLATTGTSQANNLWTINSLVNGGRSGEALTNTRTNTGLSVNLPYYVAAGFNVSNPYREYSNQDVLGDANNDWWNLEYRVDKSTAPINDLTANVFYSSGPDFDVVFFVNVPPVYKVQFTPPP